MTELTTSKTERDPKTAKNRKLCQEYCQTYQSKFRDIEYLSSNQLIELTTQRKDDIVLVDVRTNPEREVSVIEGAITKEEFSQRAHEIPQNAQVVLYCTIGYRSGLEARRLKIKYPEFQTRIKSLDGIVSYTHALGETLNTRKYQNEKSEKEPPSAAPRKICHPQTGQSTKKVHTFGGVWGLVDDEYFESTHFSIPELLLRLMQVSGSVVSCVWLRSKHFCSSLRSAEHPKAKHY